MPQGGLDAILQRPTPGRNDAFTLTSDPLKFLVKKLYSLACPSPRRSVSPADNPIRVVCVSDTHNVHHELPVPPPGDILIHSGDLSRSGTLHEVQGALSWLADQHHQYKIVIAGNHDTCLSDESLHSTIDWKKLGITYLQDSSTFVTVNSRKLHVYGSPHTPKHGSWAFQYPRRSTVSPDTASTPLASPWASLPLTIDILVTHGPPKSHLDLGFGCPDLLAAIWRVRPQLHVFGHTHAGRGLEKVAWTPTQLLYEKIMCGRGAWIDLFAMAYHAIGEWWKPTSGYTGSNNSTLLVNAASITGWRDEERNPAIVVDI